MRPLHLRLVGFTCYERPQEVDFSKLGVFAIAGPTGAGKTSLLDAMLYALYGRVPRLDRRGVGDLIAHGAGTASVTFDFALEDGSYRVTRKARRSGPTVAQLERISDTADPVSLAGGVREVEAAIARLLHIGYDAFVQAIVLPQGEFARFLKSTPGDRRVILRELLRLEAYERMRTRAEQNRRRADGQTAALRTRLEEDYEDATTDRSQQIRERLAEIERESEAARLESENHQARLQAIENGLRSLSALRQTEDELRRLDHESSAMEEIRRRLEVAERAEAIAAKIETADNAQQRTRTAHRRMQEAREAWRSAENAFVELGKRLRRVASEEERLPSLREQLAGLRSAIDRRSARERAEKQLRHARDELAVAERLRDELAEELHTARQDAERLTKESADFEKQRRKIGFQPAEYERLVDLRERATLLAQRRDRCSERSQAHEQAETATRQLSAVVEERERASEQCTAEFEELRRSLDQAEAELEKAAQENRAAALRDRLRPGEPCPVCHQIVTDPPSGIVVPAVASLRDVADRRREAVAVAEKKLADARVSLEVERGRFLASQDREQELATAEREDRDHCEAESRLLAEAAGFDGRRSQPVESAILERLEELEADRQRTTDLDRQGSQTAAEARSRQKSVEDLEQRLDDYRQRAESALARLDLAWETVAEFGDVEDGDPEQEYEAARTAIEDIERWAEGVRQEANAAERAKAESLARYEAAREEAERAESEATSARTIALDRTRSAGFADLDAARAARLDMSEREKLLKSVREHDLARHRATQRRDELVGEIGDRHWTEQDLTSAANRTRELRGQLDALVLEQGRLQQTLTDLESKIEKAGRLRDSLATAEKEARIQRTLAEELRSDHFQAYLLDDALRRLVEGASDRLFALSGRYRLVLRDDGEFLVEDHDHARETRSADTLSGGETFLASLALALELSGQVQRAAGAVRLDSLFIDEGFGTLDSETLDAAASAIEILGAGDRMVGVITHVAELTTRLPARLEVEKRPDGSFVRMVEADE